LEVVYNIATELLIGPLVVWLGISLEMRSEFKFSIKTGSPNKKFRRRWN